MKEAENMAGIDWKSYLEGNDECKCKRVHTCGIEEIILEEHAIYKVPQLLEKYKYKNICIVCDLNTQEAAGYKLYGVLEKEEYVFHKIVFQKRDLVPDEKAIAYILTEMPKGCDLLIAVGSGTINDLCRFVSFKVGIDYFIVGTAPSMDGYASTVSALIINHLKTTYETHCAKAIIGDLNVIAEAPVPMIAAGIGDILGKYVCLTDWQIAHIINGEYICEEVVGIVERCIQKVVQSAKMQAKEILRL